MENYRQMKHSKFTLGILVCDHINEKLRPDFVDYPTMFNLLIGQIDPTLAIRYYFVIDNEFPADFDDCDAYMTSGSKHGVNDNLTWVSRLEDFIVKLYQQEKPLVGICFGHQMIAKALGGKVEKSNSGWGVGIHTSALVAESSSLNFGLDELRLIVSHQDQISILPADAKTLYTSDFCPYSMIQVGDDFIGIQGHPEFTKAYSTALMDLRKTIIPGNIIEKGQKSLTEKDNALETMSKLIKFLKSHSN